jgi:NitT/TauT family transport system substrate-binding protein
VYYAQDLGLFQRAGLNVDIEQFQGGESIVAGIAAGAIQIGAGNPVPLANAHLHGIDVMLVAPGTMNDETLQPVLSGMVVAANSPLQTAKDLNGKTIGVNTLHSVDQIAAQTWADKNGGDSRTLRFLEIPNLTIVDAISQNRIDAGIVADPGYTTGIESGRVRRFASVNSGIAKRFMITAWFSTRAWANSNADTLHKFDAILNQGATWAVKNPEAAAAVLHKYLRLSTTRAHERHAATLDPAMLQPLIDAAVRYKVLAQPLDVRDIIWH